MISSDRPSRRYVFVWLVASALLIGVWSAPIIAVDSFGVFRKLGVPNFGLPPRVWTRMSAAERATDHCDTVLLGTSQVVFSYGVQPIDLGGERVCNGALGGGTMYEVEKAARLLVHEARPKRVILFLDIMMYHDKRTIREDFSQSRLNPDRTRLTYYLWSATSFDAFSSTLESVGISAPWLDDTYSRRPKIYLATRGNLRAFLKWPKFFRDFEGPTLGLEKTRAVIELLREAGVEVLIILPAEHAYHYESTRVSRLWPAYREWKTRLVTLAASFDPVVPVWDFQAYHRPAIMPLPLFSTDPINPFWYDPIHPSEYLGAYMYGRVMAGESAAAQQWDDNFGQLLTPENVDAQLDEMERDREAWIAANPQFVHRYRSLLAWTLEEEPQLLEDWRVNQQRWHQDDRRLRPASEPDPLMRPFKRNGRGAE